MRVVNKDAEASLIELLNLIDEDRKGWQAICFSFSRLLEHYRSEYQIKIATNLMNDLLGDHDGSIYLCEDATIYVVVRHFQKSLMEKMVFQLRYLFMDDPLAYTPEGDENQEFATLYELEDQWEDFMKICKRRFVNKLRGTKNPEAPIASAASVVDALSGTPAKAVMSPGESLNNESMRPYVLKEMRLFTAASLAQIENDLRGIDLTTTIRRQPVCAAIPHTPMRTVFDEMYININHLRQSMGIEVDLLSSRWLFKYLTQILDERMLETIQRQPELFFNAPVSLNLNVPTLLSKTFADFHEAMKPLSKISVVIELQIADVFSDMAAFLVARDAVQKMGYRVCLDGVTELSFPHIDRQRLGFDLIKLMWNADGEQDINSEKNQRLSDAIRNCGNNRIILARCDTQSAVEFGQALGLSLFQGRYLDSIVNPKATVMN